MMVSLAESEAEDRGLGHAPLIPLPYRLARDTKFVRLAPKAPQHQASPRSDLHLWPSHPHQSSSISRQEACEVCAILLALNVLLCFVAQDGTRWRRRFRFCNHFHIYGRAAYLAGSVRTKGSWRTNSRPTRHDQIREFFVGICPRIATQEV